MEFLGGVDGISMGSLWGFKRMSMAMGFLLDSCVVSMGFPWWFFGFFLGFLWDFCGVSMICLLDFYGFLWHSYGASMMFL